MQSFQRATGVLGIDPLFDEGLECAERPKEANVPVEVQLYPGMFHDFWRTGGVLSEAHRAIESAAIRMRLALLV